MHFNYEIEFIDSDEEVLGTLEGKKGATTLSHSLIVTKDTEVMARFKVGDIRGPDSDAVAVMQSSGIPLVSHKYLNVTLFVYCRNYRKYRKPLCGVYSGGYTNKCCTINSNCICYLCANTREKRKKYL